LSVSFCECEDAINTACKRLRNRAVVRSLLGRYVEAEGYKTSRLTSNRRLSPRAQTPLRIHTCPPPLRTQPHSRHRHQSAVNPIHWPRAISWSRKSTCATCTRKLTCRILSGPNPAARASPPSSSTSLTAVPRLSYQSPRQHRLQLGRLGR
jgi:hypothetical protein